MPACPTRCWLESRLNTVGKCAPSESVIAEVVSSCGKVWSARRRELEFSSALGGMEDGMFITSPLIVCGAIVRCPRSSPASTHPQCNSNTNQLNAHKVWELELATSGGSILEFDKVLSKNQNCWELHWSSSNLWSDQDAQSDISRGNGTQRRRFHGKRK